MNTALTLQIGGDISKLRAELNKANGLLGGFKNQLSQIGAALGLTFGTAALFRGIKEGIIIASTFEKTMSEVKAITGATGDEFKALEKDALRLGASTRYTATQVGELQVAYGRLGFSTKEILAATEATLNLAAATGENLAKSADVAGSTVRGFGLQADETERVVDVMASSFNKTALSLDNFTESMKYVAPVGNAAGATVEEVTAMLGVLADAGIRGSMAGTSLRKIFTDMTKDGRPLQERLAELARKGITLADSFDEVGRTAQTSLLILSKNTEKTNQLTYALQGASGEAAKMARIMQDNLSGDVTKLTSAWEGFILRLTNTKPIRELIKDLTMLVNALSGTHSLDDALRNSSLAIKKLSDTPGVGKSDVWKVMVKNLGDARREMGKPIDISHVEAVANMYNLTSVQADILARAVQQANKALSFSEKAMKDFNEFAEEHKYTDLAKAVDDYKGKMYELIFAHQVALEKEPNFVAYHKEQIASYRRIIALLNDYKSGLDAVNSSTDRMINFPAFVRPGKATEAAPNIDGEFGRGTFINRDPNSSLGINPEDSGVVKEIEYNRELHESLMTLHEDRERQLEQMQATADMAVTMGTAIGDAFAQMLIGEKNFAAGLAKLTEQIITLYLQQSIAAMIKTAMADPSMPFPFGKIAIAAAGIGMVKAMFGKIGANSGGGGSSGPPGRTPSEMNIHVSSRSRIKGYDLELISEKEGMRRGRVG